MWITHGGDGLDEMTTTGPTSIVELREGAIRSFEVTPEEIGLKRAQPADLKGAMRRITLTLCLPYWKAPKTPIATLRF